MKLLLVAAAVAVAVLLKFKMKNSAFSGISPKMVDSITMEHIVSFFKKSDIIEKLKSDSNLAGVAIKKQKGDDFKIYCCLFDKSKNEVAFLDNSTFAVAYISKKLSDDVKEQFGDKEMIFLQ